MSTAQVNLQEVREREQHGFCQLAKQRPDIRSKKPRVVKAQAKAQFPKAGNLPGYWHAQEADIQPQTPSV